MAGEGNAAGAYLEPCLCGARFHLLRAPGISKRRWKFGKFMERSPFVLALGGPALFPLVTGERLQRQVPVRGARLTPC